MNSKNSLKDQIVSETIKILGSQGLESLSLREVAKRLKVTHQAPYHYFSDKGALLLEVKKKGFADLGIQMRQALSNPDESPFTQLKKIGRSYFQFCSHNPGLFLVMFSASSGGANLRPPEAELAFKILLNPIHRLQKSGKLEGYTPEVIALIGWTTMHGLVSLAIERYPVLGGKLSIEDLSEKMLVQLHRLMGETPN